MYLVVQMNPVLSSCLIFSLTFRVIPDVIRRGGCLCGLESAFIGSLCSTISYLNLSFHDNPKRINPYIELVNRLIYFEMHHLKNR